MLKDTNDFLRKSKKLEKDRDGLDALIKFGRAWRKISTKILPELAEFVLKNSFSNCASKTVYQKLGTAIRTTFAATYASILVINFEGK